MWGSLAIQAGGVAAVAAAFMLAYPWGLLLSAGGGAVILAGWATAWRRHWDEALQHEKSQCQAAQQHLTALEERMGRTRAELDRIQGVLRDQVQVLVDDGGKRSQQAQVLEQATCEMSSWRQEVGGSIEHLSSSTEETSSSVFEMVATIEEVARHIEGMAGQVNETAAATASLVDTIKGVDASVDGLQAFVTETSGTMNQVTAAIRQVESRSSESNLLSDQVAADAEEGMKVVQQTIEGMERIRGSVGEASDAIAQLGRRSQEMGGILNVIDEVAEQTNLLALNAAIIAAQAGEHGKGFAVVADEIRGLAERTGSSTREISSLIQFFQQEAARARQSMEDGSRQVAAGSSLTGRAGQELTKILRSAQESSRVAGEIAQTTREQGQGAQIVVAAVERLKEMVAQLAAITTEQTERSGSILGTVTRMRELSEQVKRATMEQAKGGRLITEAIQSVTDSVGSIHQATLRQDSENERVAAALSTFRGIGAENHDSMEQVMRTTREMQELLRTLSAAGAAPR
jgi:methyl-accepting chemotaxis protein